MTVASSNRLWGHPGRELARIESSRVLRSADAYLSEPPKTITSEPESRSPGGLHDYYSEGDYWWPDPAHPSGPYLRRDGQSNPANFVAHRQLLIRFSIHVPALTAAWILTGKDRYAEHAIAHLHAWLVDPRTKMNPNLEFAQAIHGIATGRSIGIIDTVHLAEVARAAWILKRKGRIGEIGIEAWFTEYLQWLTSSERGQAERGEKNNHGSCWLLQAAAFASCIGDMTIVEHCRQRFREVAIPGQIAQDGSFPLELARTKPYSYSLFNLDALCMIAQILSNGSGNHDKSNLWNFRLPDGRGLEAACRFMFPYIQDKRSWPFPHDVEYFDDLPVRQPGLLFAGLAYRQQSYLQLWERLDGEPVVAEVIRNHPIRQPLLWLH